MTELEAIESLSLEIQYLVHLIEKTTNDLKNLRESVSSIDSHSVENNQDWNQISL
jgi:hypothetical protein